MSEIIVSAYLVVVATFFLEVICVVRNGAIAVVAGSNSKMISVINSAVGSDYEFHSVIAIYAIYQGLGIHSCDGTFITVHHYKEYGHCQSCSDHGIDILESQHALEFLRFMRSCENCDSIRDVLIVYFIYESVDVITGVNAFIELSVAAIILCYGFVAFIILNLCLFFFS